MNVLANNLSALGANRQLGIQTKDLEKSARKLSSGFQINKAADNAAGLKISEKMRSQIRGLERGERNTTEGISWIQVTDGAMSEMQDMLQRLVELSIQAANDTNNVEDRFAIDQEITEIKKELNRISLETEFNRQKVFDNSSTMMYISSDTPPNDLLIFNSSYDSLTGKATYGGFVFHGERILWDQVDPGMVQIDASGKQIFKGGNYTYTNPATGHKFQFTCKDGDEVPVITRTLNISANGSGIVIDGMQMSWSQLKDEDDRSFGIGNMHGGSWHIDYMGTTIDFFTPDTVDSTSDMIDTINKMHDGKVKYTWQITTVGSENETAVKSSVMQNLRVSQALADSLGTSTDVQFQVKAGKTDPDQNGIWLADSNGNAVAGSYKSWADMGITSWEQGNDISALRTYTYSDTDGTNDTFLSFNFTLSDITSVDSVIDGLDGMVISGKNIKTDYQLTSGIDLPADSNIESSTHTNPTGTVTFPEENALGRDFDTQQISNMANASSVYDSTSQSATVDFAGTDGSTAIQFLADTKDAEDQMKKDLDAYADYVLSQKTTLLLAGLSPQLPDYSLKDLVGAGNISQPGPFTNDVVTIDKNNNNNMITTGRPGSTDGNGSAHPGAFIDFQNLGKPGGFELKDLIGTGFNSNCKTCTNHYSVMFVYAPDGPDYTNSSQKTPITKPDGKPGERTDYLMQINVASLEAKGINSGPDLTKELIDLFKKGGYDFHYTQYAAEDSKLYIYDYRTHWSVDYSSFGTEPFAMGADTFKFTFKADYTGASGSLPERKFDASFKYNYSEIANSISVDMKANPNAGEYVKLASPNGHYSYVKYDASNPSHQNQDRYDLDITYKNADGSSAANYDEITKEYIQSAIKEMTESVSVQLHANDYTKMDVSGQNKPNVAIRTVFKSVLTEVRQPEFMHIQFSSRYHDSLRIPKIPMNTIVLGIVQNGTKTYAESQAMIRAAHYAIDYLSDKRAMYGAYQNRLEHAFNYSANAEENSQAAESRLRDTDMASEMVAFSKSRILSEAGQSVLSHAVKMNENILSLLN